jgi:hypothetical protein
VKKSSVRVLLGLLICGAAFADTGGGGGGGGGPNLPCYQLVWWNYYNVCDTCSSYSECPGQVLCDPAATGGKTTTPIVTSPVPCDDYIGGAGTCPNCTGGRYVSSTTMTVIVPNQTCPGSCP